MADRTGYSIYIAAVTLLERGFDIKQVNDILNAAEKPTEGYVYADQLPEVSDTVKSTEE